MPLEIWNHLFHPFTYTAVNGDPQDFSSDDISRVKKIASGSIVVGALEAFSSARSVKFSIITIGLTTLVIFYIATAIFKGLNRGNADPKQPSPLSPGLEPEPNRDKNLEAQAEQLKKEGGETPSIAQVLPEQLVPSLQPIIPSSSQASIDSPTTEEPKDPILAAQGLLPQPVPISQPIIPSGSQDSIDSPTSEEPKDLILAAQGLLPQPVSTSSRMDFAIQEEYLDGDKKLDEEGSQKLGQSSADKGLKIEKKELGTQEIPPPEKHKDIPLSPQLKPTQVNIGEQDQKKLDKPKPSTPASPQLTVQVLKQKLYGDLPLTDEDAKIIHQIIEMIGSLNVLAIPFKTPLLIELGNKIQHVHPLKFLEKVLNTPQLKLSMIKVEDSTVKWNGFLWGNSLDGSSGFKAKCNRETDQKNFAIYIDDFCKVVKAPVEKVRPFVEKKDWEGLVRFLIKLK